MGDIVNKQKLIGDDESANGKRTEGIRTQSGMFVRGDEERHYPVVERRLGHGGDLGLNTGHKCERLPCSPLSEPSYPTCPRPSRAQVECAEEPEMLLVRSNVWTAVEADIYTAGTGGHHP
jgi:hypothetical protein